MTDNDKNVKIQTLADQFISGSKVDYIGFWEIVAQVKKLIDLDDKKELKKICIEVAKLLLEGGLIAFNFERNDDGSFSIIPWDNQTPDICATRFDQEWSALLVDPNPGDICWFKRAEGLPVVEQV